MAFRINEIFCFIAENPPDGDEGLVAIFHNGEWLPLVAANEARLADLMPLAKRAACERRIEIKLIRLSSREEVETILPETN